MNGKYPEDKKTALDYFLLILKARVYDLAVESPLTLAKSLSVKAGNHVYFKREDLQPVFSFKLRGAYNKIKHLTDEERARGIICASAGNHAQGVAMAANKMGLKAKVIMPVFTPSIKVNAVRNYGAEVILHGNDFDEAKRECAKLTAETGMTFIHPYDDPLVIAGQGTIGMEIMKQLNNSDCHAIFCAVGGGGLISGIASYVKLLNPNVKVIGVETVDANAMYLSLQTGKRVELTECGLFADGAAVRFVGEETFRICKELVDEIILVTNDEVCAAIKDVYGDTRSVIEPAGALGVAGAKKYLHREGLKDHSVVCVTSGANVDFNRLRFIAERAQMGERKEVLLSVVIPETPGSFLKLYSVLHPRLVTEFSYRYSDSKDAYVFLSCEVTDYDTEVPVLLENLKKNGFIPLNITDNEMAKAHARYLSGGRSATVTNEQLYRFEFPQRPCALQSFLLALQSNTMLWNISLFHYRNHGADVGRVLAGIQVPEAEQASFMESLNKLGYPYVNENENPVYKQFLK